MTAKRRAVKILSLVTLILLFCSGLLTGYSLKGPAAGGRTATEEAVYEITNVPVNEVAAVAVTNARASFGFLVKGSEFEAVSKVQGNYSPTEVRSLIYAMAHLTGSRRITDLANARQYGMDSPTASLSLIKTDGTQIELSLLSQNPMDGNYYLFSEQDQAVYLIPAGVAGLFMRQETDFFRHTVLPAVSASDFNKLDRITMDFNGGGRNYRIVRRNASFYLEAPIEQRVSSVSLAQKLIIPLSALYSDQFVASAADLSGYGFDDYTLRVEMMYGGQQYTAKLLDAGGGRCLMADEITGDVYELGIESLTALMEDYTALLDGKAFTYSGGDVMSVDVDDGGEHTTVKLSGEGAGQAQINGGGMGEKETALLAVLNDAQIVSEVSGGSAGLPGDGQEPAMTLTFTMQSGSIDVIRLFAAPQGGYYADVNGTVNFTVSERYTEAVKTALEAYGK